MPGDRDNTGYSTSASSCSSPRSYVDTSPHDSPMEHVPNLTNNLASLSCSDTYYLDISNANGTKPFLRILEEPNGSFRFRYRSEMVGTHGCIVGKSSGRNKTFPTVELVNYSESALIRCRLAQRDNDEDHPHQLRENDENDGDEVCAKVGPEGYVVRFQGLGIIHAVKKNVGEILFEKYKANSGIPLKDLRAQCEQMAKKIDLNRVRLKFSAHDIKTNKEICPPVFSEPIFNLKSAETNDLRLCRMSLASGDVGGQEDLFLLVEKVTKNNIEVRFLEIDNKTGETIWMEKATFSQNDVHHQYAIVVKTPPYRNEEISRRVTVYVELHRPRDGKTSNRMAFEYVGTKGRKKRKYDSYCSIGSSDDSLSDLPKPVQMINMDEKGGIVISTPPVLRAAPPPSQTSLASGLMDQHMAPATVNYRSSVPVGLRAMLGAPNIPQLSLNSGEMRRLTAAEVAPDDFAKFIQDFQDTPLYIKEYTECLPNLSTEGLDFDDALMPDSGRGQAISAEMARPSIKVEPEDEYTAHYSASDGMEVKQIVKDLCETLLNKDTAHYKVGIRHKLDKLMSYRLSNGDTFMHMTLSNNILPSLQYIVKLASTLKMTHLLNTTNELERSLLHIAVLKDLPKQVDFLISQGCDPNITDNNGDTALHYAVRTQLCISAILAAVKKYKVPADLNAKNNAHKTPLHIATSRGLSRVTAALLSAGASIRVGDAAGRTALHHSVYSGCATTIRTVLKYCGKEDVEQCDGAGFSALQVAAGATPDARALQAVQLLLQAGADPLKHSANNESAWIIARHNAEIRRAISIYVPLEVLLHDDVKSEPEDEYESAEEGEPEDTSLEGLSLYVDELSAILDASGAWRKLAERTHCAALLSWYEGTASPTRTLLSQIKECNISSSSLAMILRDMGEQQAAYVITKHIT